MAIVLMCSTLTVMQTLQLQCSMMVYNICGHVIDKVLALCEGASTVGRCITSSTVITQIERIVPRVGIVDGIGSFPISGRAYVLQGSNPHCSRSYTLYLD